MQDGFWWVLLTLFLWPGQVQGMYPSSCPHPAANDWPDRRRWLLLAAGPREALVVSRGGGGGDGGDGGG